MRIAFVQPKMTSRGGAESVIVWLAAALAVRGHEVTILSQNHRPAIWEGDLEGAPVRFVDLWPRHLELLGKRLQSRILGKQIRSQIAAMDVVCANNFPSTWWVDRAVAGGNLGVRTVLYCHEPNRSAYYPITDAQTVDYLERTGGFRLPNHEEITAAVRERTRRARRWQLRSRRRLDRAVVQRYTTVIANSEFTAGNMERAWGRTPAVCRPGVPRRGRLGSPEMDGRTGVVCLSTLVLNKNLFGVLGAWDRLVNHYCREDIELHLVGRLGEQRVQKFLREHGLESTVRLHGFIREEEKARIFSSARLCLFVPFAEPLGLVTLEAMLHGTPVIGSCYGGPAEVIQNGVTGLLTDPYDPDAIARSVMEIHDDIPRLAAMARAAQELARREYVLDRFAQQFERLVLAPRGTTSQAGADGASGE